MRRNFAVIVHPAKFNANYDFFMTMRAKLEKDALGIIHFHLTNFHKKHKLALEAAERKRLAEEKLKKETEQAMSKLFKQE